MNDKELQEQHEKDTRQMSDLVIVQQTHASIINRLANIILDIHSKHTTANERWEAEQAIERVRHLL